MNTQYSSHDSKVRSGVSGATVGWAPPDHCRQPLWAARAAYNLTTLGLILVLSACTYIDVHTEDVTVTLTATCSGEVK